MHRVKEAAACERLKRKSLELCPSARTVKRIRALVKVLGARMWPAKAERRSRKCARHKATPNAAAARFSLYVKQALWHPWWFPIAVASAGAS